MYVYVYLYSTRGLSWMRDTGNDKLKYIHAYVYVRIRTYIYLYVNAYSICKLNWKRDTAKVFQV
jgi:hypothetical protein